MTSSKTISPFSLPRIRVGRSCDRIVTGGGLIGQITRVIGENELIVEIAQDIKVRVMRSMVSDVMTKSEPAGGEDDDDFDDDEDDETGGEEDEAEAEEKEKPRSRRRRRAKRKARN